jgi:triacylglycerol lipase
MIDDIALCLAASAAYIDSPTILKDDIHVVFSQVGDVTIVAFRGTEPTDISDWIRDFDAIPIDTKELGICHRGFYTGASLVLPELIDRLQGCKFVITGHSLGGALAILAGALLAFNNLIPLQLTTLGAPNISVGDRVKKFLNNTPGYRYRNGNDPVPLIPTWPYGIDREHTQIGQPLLNPISDHMLDQYLKALKETKNG